MNNSNQIDQSDAGDDDLSPNDIPDYDEIELEREYDEFERFLHDFDLESYLSQDEVQVIYDIWNARKHTEFMIEAGDVMRRIKLVDPTNNAWIHERATTRQETRFVALRQKLGEIQGWALLPPEIRSRAEDRLLSINFEQETGDDDSES